MPIDGKQAFRNDTSMVHGCVMVSGHKREPKGLPVQPGAVIWLSPEEQELTARAPARAEDNPFANGTFVAVDEDRPTGERWYPAMGPQETPAEPDEGAPEGETPEEAVEAPTEDETATTPRAPQIPEETGIEPEPAQVEGERAAEEEVATPSAEKRPRVPVAAKA